MAVLGESGGGVVFLSHDTIVKKVVIRIMLSILEVAARIVISTNLFDCKGKKIQESEIV